jgi:hypothetical protein
MDLFSLGACFISLFWVLQSHGALPNAQYIALEKAVNVLVFKSAEANTPQPFTAQEWDFIGEIARRCPQDWGDGVIKARSLRLKHGGGFEAAWQQCFPTHESETPSNSGKQVLELSKDTLRSALVMQSPIVYPVPAADQCTIVTPDAYLGSTYQVVSSTGLLISSGIITTSQLQIPTSDWCKGVYFIRVQHPAYRPVTLKVIIQKL